MIGERNDVVASQRASTEQPVTEETSLLGPLPETTDPDEQESWHTPSINTYRFISVNLTLFNLGMNDACIGVWSFAFLFLLARLAD